MGMHLEEAGDPNDQAFPRRCMSEDRDFRPAHNPSRLRESLEQVAGTQALGWKF